MADGIDTFLEKITKMAQLLTFNSLLDKPTGYTVPTNAKCQ